MQGNVSGTGRGGDVVSNGHDDLDGIGADAVIERIEHELTMLLRRAEVTGEHRPAADRLTRSGYVLLGALESNGPLGIAALADATYVDVSTASRQIGPLERQGLVRRLPNPADRRGTLVDITAPGRERLRATREERLTAYHQILRDWPERDRAALAGYLSRLNHGIMAYEQVRDAGPHLVEEGKTQETGPGWIQPPTTD
jgi:DNA-binding MarR family transcriptional regulator